MDTRETERFLNRVYEEGDRFEVLYRDNDGVVARKEMAYDPSGPFLDEVQRAENGGFNVYVSAMPLDVQATGQYDRIWVDQDDCDAAWPFGSGEVNWPQPTTLVKTSDGIGGFRWQAIWLLDRDIDTEKARSAMKRLSKLIGADEGVHDSRRVLRLAGVMNAKRGSQARLMETTEGRISISGFDLPNETALTKLLTAEIQNPNHVLGEFLEGVSEGDRNRSAYMAARHLKNAAVQYNDAAAFLKLGAGRCDPPMDDRELEHALDSAYHRGA